jgi:hypothetical protein
MEQRGGRDGVGSGSRRHARRINQFFLIGKRGAPRGSRGTRKLATLHR